VAALEEWLQMDHKARWASYREKVATMQERIADVSGIMTKAEHFTMDERLIDEPVNCMTIAFTDEPNRADQVSAQLLNGDPSIATVVIDHKLVVAVDTVLEGQDLAIADRLRQVLDSTESVNE